MKKNIILRQLFFIGFFLYISAFMTSCLMEYPEKTENGEVGIDPTFVTLTTKVMIDLKNSGSEDIELNSRVDEKVYRHRIVVAAYEGRELRTQETVYEDKPLTNRLQTEVNLKLHARKYTIVVWADYFCDEENPIYNLNTPDGLLAIKGSDSYLGNTEYKKVYSSSEDVDLTDYKNKWGSEIHMEMKVESPMVRYELIATDVKKFLDNNPKVNSIKLTLNYDDYIPTGFNALDGITKHAFRNQSFTSTIKRPESGVTELPLIFDYLFVDSSSSRSDGITITPVTLKVEDVTNANNPVELASSSFNLVLGNSEGEKITFDFLTTKPCDGVGIDSDFGGNKEVEVPVE